MSIDGDQRARLLATKLASLVRARTGDDCAPDATGAVVAVQVDGTAFALLESGTAAALAGALLWAGRRGADRLVLFVDADAGRVARLAAYFAFGDVPVEVLRVEGAAAVPVEPAALPEPATETVGALSLVDQLSDAGLEVVVEHGTVRGEVLGLEVARLVEWPADLGGDGELHLEAGVGRFDRDAVAAVHPDEAPADSLARTVDAVRQHRYPGAPSHPLQLMARERWLRADLVADPGIIGASELTAVGMTSEPSGLKDAHPAAALGVDHDGAPVVVVCSSGVDLSLVPLAADTRARYEPTARLLIALPERDLHPATIELAGLLDGDVEVRAVPHGWG